MFKFISKKKTTVIILATLIILFCSIWIGQNIPEQENGSRKTILQEENMPSGSDNILSENILPDKAILEINGERYEGEVKENENVYDFMARLRNEGKIDFKEKNYVVLGSFIEEINGVRGNGNKNWIYYVNGKEAEIGVSKYKIVPGDVVSWKYENNY
jgi:hypothetical protein